MSVNVPYMTSTLKGGSSLSVLTSVPAYCVVTVPSAPTVVPLSAGAVPDVPGPVVSEPAVPVSPPLLPGLPPQAARDRVIIRASSRAIVFFFIIFPFFSSGLCVFPSGAERRTG